MNMLVRLSVIVALCFLSRVGYAQLPSPGQTGINAALTKLFGDFQSFSSKSEVRMLDKAQKQSLSMLMDFAMLDGKIRADIDLSRIKSDQMPAEALSYLKQMGMDKMQTIVHPELKTTLVVYPALKSYANTPMSAEEAAGLTYKYEVRKEKLGQEEVEGRACEKMKVTISSEKGGKHEAVIWCDPSLKNFPVKMQIPSEDSTVIMFYREVKLQKPEARLFEVPASYTKYDSIEKLMQSAMMKMMGGK